MTKSTSFRLSDDALEQLAALAKRFNKSQAAVLEHMIFDRASISDWKANSHRRKMAWVKFAQDHDLDFWDKHSIFQEAYNRGWLDFQTRHGENDFIIPAPPTEKE